MILARELEVGYANRSLLGKLSLELPAGECWAVVGRNGAGKSTLLATLAGLTPPLHGDIEWLGRPAASWPRSELALHLAYLPQRNLAVFPYTVEEFVRFGRVPWQRRRRSTQEEDDAAVAGALAALQLNSFRNSNLTVLSGGETQRVCLAQLYAQETEILLLDEPLAHLDLLHQVDTMRLLRKLAGSNRCVVMATHDLDLAWRYCHGLLVLGAGEARLVAREHPDVARQTLREAYGVDFEVGVGLAVKH